jgi:hypothetical protein
VEVWNIREKSMIGLYNVDIPNDEIMKKIQEIYETYPECQDETMSRDIRKLLNRIN